MKALIVEDEHMAQAQLARTISANFEDIEVVAMTDSVQSTVEYLRSNPAPDIIFMDVELSDGECFDIFRQVPVNSKVIMTTAYDSYAIKAFEAGSIDYLLKPIDIAALRRAVGRCREMSGSLDVEKLLKAIGEQSMPSGVSDGQKKQYKERMTVRIGDKIIPVKIDDVAYFYSDEKANYVTMCSGENYLIESRMDTLASDLDPEKFFRINRGCIVSRQIVSSVNRHFSGRLLIDCRPRPQFEMIVARTRVDKFLAWLG